MKMKLVLEAEDESENEQVADVADYAASRFDEALVEPAEDAEPKPHRSGTSGDDRAPIPTDELQAVYEAVSMDPGRSRGKYHEALIDDDRIWYEDSEDDAYDERSDLGDKMWDLEHQGYLRHNGRRWYPA